MSFQSSSKSTVSPASKGQSPVFKCQEWMLCMGSCGYLLWTLLLSTLTQCTNMHHLKKKQEELFPFDANPKPAATSTSANNNNVSINLTRSTDSCRNNEIRGHFITFRS